MRVRPDEADLLGRVDTDTHAPTKSSRSNGLFLPQILMQILILAVFLPFHI